MKAKAKTFLFVCIVLFAFAVQALAVAPQDLRKFSPPPYSYTEFKGGNCVWFAWEMAYQKWGIKLPWAGDARKWKNLDKSKILQDGAEYVLGLSEKPVKDSILILQPADLRALNGGKPFANDFYGHVAWVSEVENIGGRVFVRVLESSVYPPDSGEYWHGCWWREYVYPIDVFVSARFLYVDRIRTKDFQMKSQIGEDGSVSFAVFTESEKSFWQVRDNIRKFLGNSRNGSLVLKAETVFSPNGKIVSSEPFNLFSDITAKGVVLCKNISLKRILH